jgi:hypothetical protein
MRFQYVFLVVVALLVGCAGHKPLTQTGGVDTQTVYENRLEYIKDVQEDFRDWQGELCEKKAELDMDVDPATYERQSARLDQLENQLKDARRELYVLKSGTREDWSGQPARIDVRRQQLRQSMEQLEAE